MGLTHLSVVMCCLFVLCSGYYKKAEIPKCDKPHEYRTCTQDCPPQRTCRNRDDKFVCLENTSRCQLKCVCDAGYVRNAIGECILEKYCDECPGPHEYYSCGPICDNVCEDLENQNKTNCPIPSSNCVNKCYCDNGYARNGYNICVPIAKCPKKDEYDNNL